MKKLFLAALLALLAPIATAQVFQYYGPAVGVQKNTGSTYQNTSAAASDIAALWTGTNCGTTTNVPLLNGNCTTPQASAGAVKSVQWSNGSGAFQGNTDFTWDDTNSVLQLGSAVIGGPVISTQAITGPVANSVILQGGFASTSGTAGADAIVSGGTSTNGAGGNGQLHGGNGVGAGNAGGGAIVQGGSAANGNGGGVSIFSGSGSTGSSSGALTETTTAASGAGNSGALSIATGSASGSGTSGNLSISTGSSSTSTAGNISITAGGSSGGGTSGSVTITATHNTGTDGNITLAAHGATVETIQSGIQVGAPTGGDCGVGCLNAQSLKINNVSVGTNTGTVSSVSAGTGITASPSPIVSTGTLSVDQTFSPTWTGTHGFNGAYVTSSATSLTSPGQNGISFVNSGSGSNAKIWDILQSTANHLTFRAVNDTFGSAGNWLDVVRSGLTISTITVGNTTDKPAITLNGATTIPAPSSGTALSVSGVANTYTTLVTGNSTSGQSFGLRVNAGTTSADAVLNLQTQAAATLMTVAGDGGVTVGVPTGGDKGLGTLNTAGDVYTNNVVQRVASLQANCTAGGCTATTTNGFSTTVTRNTAGTYTATFSPSFSSAPVCVATPFATGFSDYAAVGTISSTTVQIEIGATGAATDAPFTVICNGP